MPLYDERLYTAVKALSDVTALCGSRVYHIEILQSAADTPFSKYPAIVYHVQSNVPLYELHQRSGWRRAVFIFTIFGRSTADLRTLSKAIDGLSGDTTIADSLSFGWITVEDISDDYEIPFEYDEKAMKSSTLTITLTYEEE